MICICRSGYTLLFMLSLLLYEIMVVLKVYNSDSYSEIIRGGGLFIVMILGMLRLMYLKVNMPKYTLSLIVYVFLFLIFNSFHGGFSTDKVLSIIFYPLVFIMSLSVFSRKSSVNSNMIWWFGILSTLIFSLLFLYYYSFLGKMTGMVKNSIYYQIVLLPTLLIFSRRVITKLVMLMVFVCILLSEKRGALILFLVSGFSFYLASYGFLIFKKILLVSILLWSYVLLSGFEIGIFDRLSTLIDDGGSGRTDIIVTLLLGFWEGGVQTLLFGNGLYSSIDLVGFTAHNDFLEVLYSFGMFGFIIYMLHIVTIFYMGIRFNKNGYRYYPIILSSIVIFVGMSIVTHIILYPAYVAFIAMLWAYLISDFIKIKNGDV